MAMETRAPQNCSRVHTLKSKGVLLLVLTLMLGEHKTEIIVRSLRVRTRIFEIQGDEDVDESLLGIVILIRLCICINLHNQPMSARFKKWFCRTWVKLK